MTDVVRLRIVHSTLLSGEIEMMNFLSKITEYTSQADARFPQYTYRQGCTTLSPIYFTTSQANQPVQIHWLNIQTPIYRNKLIFENELESAFGLNFGYLT